MVLVGESGVGKSSLIQQFTQVSDTWSQTQTLITNTHTGHRHRHRSQITDHKLRRTKVTGIDQHYSCILEIYLIYTFFVTLPHCNYFVIITVCSGCIWAGPTCNNRSVQTLYFLAYFPPRWRNILFVQLCKLHFNIGRKLNFTFARSWVCPAWDGGRGKEGELFGLQWLVTWKPCEKLPPLNWKDTVAKS